MNNKRYNYAFLANWGLVLNGEGLQHKHGSMYLQRVMAFTGLALVLLCGWLEQSFSQSATFFALYLLLYPHTSQIAATLICRRAGNIPANPALLSVDALHLGIAISLSGFALVPALASVCLLFFYLLLRREAWYALPGLLLLILGSSSGLLLAVPVNLDTPPLTTALSMALLLLQLAVCAQLLQRHAQNIQLLREEMQASQDRHDNLSRDLAKYLSPQVWHLVFRKNNTLSDPFKTQRKKLTVFFSDIKGFTDLSEEMEPEDLTDILNGYLSEMTAIAIKHGGTVDKFIGDSIMVFFGDTRSRGARHDAISAVSMAIEMRKHMSTLRQRWQAKGIHKRLEIRMGLNTGYCTVGTFGAESRMDYTVIGREVNLASRLESAAGADEILISGETYTLIKDKIMGRDKGQIQVKGFARPVSIYQVMDYRRDLGPARSYLAHELPGFSMQLDTANLELENIDHVVRVLNEALAQLQE